MENLPLDLYRESLALMINASEVKEISVEVRNTSDRGHFLLSIRYFAFIIFSVKDGKSSKTLGRLKQILRCTRSAFFILG